METSVLKFEKNELGGKDYVVGDIHGCYHLLDKALNWVEFNYETDRLFSVGDLCDRGPYSSRVLEFADQLWFHAVRGNHEEMYLRAYEAMYMDGDHDDLLLFIRNGGHWLSGIDTDSARRIYEYFSSLPYVIEIDYGDKLVGIIHAEPRLLELGGQLSAKSWQKTLDSVEIDLLPNLDRQSLLWSRDIAAQTSYGKYRRSMPHDEEMQFWVEGVDVIHCGHTPLETEMIMGNINYIDTTAFMAGKKYGDYGLTIKEVGSLDAGKKIKSFSTEE